MAFEKKTEFVIDHAFDPKTCRHRINGTPHVLHCHHYMALYCQLADDAEIFDGKALMRRAAELSLHRLFRRYFAEHAVTDLGERLTLAAEYWRIAGMGLVTFERVGPFAASVRMDRSHVDEGWRAKWGERPTPVNFVGQGFVAAALAAAYDAPVGSFVVHEVQSMVTGAPASRFTAVRA